MISVITGDIVDSRTYEKQIWLKPLKKVLGTWGKEPANWQVYRGDSFQVEIKKPEEAIAAAIRIKAHIKETSGADIRMAIGVGQKTYSAPHITESNGEAFINSGTTFDNLGKSSLAIKTPWEDFDEVINVMLFIASLQMNRWTTGMARIVRVSLENPGATQAEIAKLAGKKNQSDISEGRARAGYDAILAVDKFYREKLKQHLSK